MPRLRSEPPKNGTGSAFRSPSDCLSFGGDPFSAARSRFKFVIRTPRPWRPPSVSPLGPSAPSQDAAPTNHGSLTPWSANLSHSSPAPTARMKVCPRPTHDPVRLRSLSGALRQTYPCISEQHYRRRAVTCRSGAEPVQFSPRQCSAAFTRSRVGGFAIAQRKKPSRHSAG